MKRAMLLLSLLALPVCAAPTRYYVKPVYTSLRFSIVSGGVLCIGGCVVTALALPGFLRYDSREPQA